LILAIMSLLVGIFFLMKVTVFVRAREDLFEGKVSFFVICILFTAFGFHMIIISVAHFFPETKPFLADFTTSFFIQSIFLQIGWKVA
tara:strand:+ start:189 stop:449 length:261 start_codon:yes stop_codon:yes gene_type:complete